MRIEIEEWEGCYEGGWKGWIVPEAFAHPAKFSRALIERIYDHALNEGWIEEGDIVLDPFAGVALGGLNAMAMGLNWVGVELEEKFVKLGEQNIELWNRELKGWPNLGTARIVQEDSRRLRDVIREAELIVSSPPYAQGLGNRDHEGDQQKFIDRQEAYRLKHPEFKRPKGSSMAYSNSKGQLSNMREGSFQDVIEKADLVVSSPPYIESPVASYDGSMGEQWKKTGRTPRQRSGGKLISEQYNIRNQANLANLKEGDFDLICSSPPYAEIGEGTKGHGIKGAKGSIGHGCKADTAEYGQSENQLGNTSGDTFWSASREIVQGCYELLKDGGHAIWVTKDYVKKGQIVPFTDRWLSLCESVGFKLVCHHHAMLVGLKFEKNHVRIVERKSFFRRLCESKGSPRIDWENVICFVK